MLTNEQAATLRAFVIADATLNAIPHTGDGAYALRDALDALATPTFTVWKTSVTLDEIQNNGFDWTQVDNLTVGKARIWEYMFNDGTANPAKANVRAGIDETWKGTAAMLAVRDVIYTHCKRSATVLEKVFATGTGSVAVPATMAVEGSLSPNELRQVMEW